MKFHNKLHPQVCSLENVMAAARASMQGEMSGHAAARFHARWETHAVCLHEELTVGSENAAMLCRVQGPVGCRER